MASQANGRTSLQFGAFEVNLASQEVFRRGVSLNLNGKPFQLLAVLLERPGEIVTREELQQRLWPNGTFVDFDRNLNTSIKKLRQSLGDSAETPSFIETLPRRGYRFIAPVRVSGNGHSAEAGSITEPQAEIGSTNSSSNRLLWLLAVFAAIAIVIAIAVLHRADHPLDVRKMRISKLTQGGKIAIMAISPDGRYLAYVAIEGLKQSLWIRELAAGDAIQLLAPDTVNIPGLSFSPDGNFLYFSRSEKTNPVFGFMCRMPAHGGKVEELIRDADSTPSFSPDGKRFVYTRGYMSRDATQIRIADIDGANDYNLVELSGHEVDAAGATWSPDGQRIAMPIHTVGDSRKFVLYVVSASGGKREEVFSSRGDIGRPLWLSSSKLLATLNSGGSHGGQLWTISYPGGLAERFTNDLTDYTSAIDISSDHKKLVTTVFSVSSNVWVASAADLSQPVQVTSGGPSPIRARELHDGRIAMLVTGVDSAKTGAPDIQSVTEDTAVSTMNLDGGHRVPWPEIKAPEAIEPCGTALLSLAMKDGNAILLRYDTDGTAPKSLAAGDVMFPACSPDGKFTYYLNAMHPEKIKRVSNSDGSTVDIGNTLGDTFFGNLAVSPDGKFLAYPYQQYSPPKVAIVVIPAAGGPSVHEFTIPGFSEMIRWSLDGRSLQYLQTSDNATNLWDQPLTGGKPRQLTHFTTSQIFDFTWTAGGKHLVMARGELNSDVVLIEDTK